MACPILISGLRRRRRPPISSNLARPARPRPTSTMSTSGDAMTLACTPTVGREVLSPLLRHMRQAMCFIRRRPTAALSDAKPVPAARQQPFQRLRPTNKTVWLDAVNDEFGEQSDTG